MAVRDSSLPSAPSPATVTLVAALIRTTLTGLAGVGVGTGLAISDAQLSAISAMALTVGSFGMWAGLGVWSQYQKCEASRADRAGSVASAEASANATQAAGTPIVVVAPPPSTSPRGRVAVALILVGLAFLGACAPILNPGPYGFG